MPHPTCATSMSAMNSKKQSGRNPRSKRRSEDASRERNLSFRSPLLARGQATFEAILDATAALLEEFGIDGVTTNRVAARAGINVATLYHYFPNKQAILVALFERQTHRRATVARDALEGLQRGGDWRSTLAAAIDAVIRLRLSEPGVVALRMAMRSDPQLKVFDAEDTQLVARVIADRIAVDDSTSRDEADAVAFCSVETIGALLDAWQLDSGGRNDQIVVQLKRMVERFVAPYFEAPSRSASRHR